MIQVKVEFKVKEVQKNVDDWSRCPPGRRSAVSDPVL
jgi:hypothetical protein